MTRASIATAALFVLACVPDRDNPHDPATQPNVVLTVSPTEGTRQTLFSLDASQSTGHGVLQYCWDLDEDPSDFEVPCGGAATLTTNLTIPPGKLGAFGEGAYEKTVRVVVKSKRSEASALATVVVSNARPVVDAGPEIVTAVGLAATVHLDGCAHPSGICVSFDPDGDDVAWRWRQVGGAPVVLATDGRLATFTAPLERQTLYFELEGSDELSIAKSRTTVRVGTIGWLATSSPSRVFRIHRETEVVPIPPEIVADYAFPVPAAAGGDVWLVEVGQVVRMDAAGSFVSRFAVSDYVESLVPRGDSACIVRGLATGGREAGLLRAPVSGVDGTYVPVAIPGTTTSDIQSVLPDPTSEMACLVTAGAKGIFRLRLDETSETFIAATPAIYFGDLGILTRDGAFWDAGGLVINGEPLLRIVRAVQGSPAVVHEVPFAGDVGAILPLDDSTILAIGRTSDGSGHLAFRVSADGFEPLVVPPLSLDTKFTSLPDGSIFAWEYHEQTIRRLRLRGIELEIEASVQAEELTSLGTSGDLVPDEWNGGIAISAERSVVRISNALRTIEQVSTVPTLGALGTVALEPGTGSLWMANAGVVSPLARVDASGRIVAYVTSLVAGFFDIPRDAGGVDGSISLLHFPAVPGPASVETYDRRGALVDEISLPAEVEDFALDASGEVACAWSFTNGIAWTVEQGVATVHATGLQLPNGTATATGECWFLSGNNALRFDDGISVQTFTSATTLTPSMRADPRDGTLWIADTDLVTLRHYAKNGALLGSIPGSPAFALERKCAAGPGCIEIWTTDGGDLVRRSDAGIELDRVSIPIPATSIIETLDVAP